MFVDIYPEKYILKLDVKFLILNFYDKQYILEFVGSKHIGSPNAKICLYDDFQYLDVKSSADKIQTAFEKLQKTSRFDDVKGFFKIARKKNYWT